MTVATLIQKLKRLDQDAEVGHFYDGRDRNDIDFVWISERGRCLMAENGECVYDDEDRPKHVPENQINYLAGDE